MSKFVIIEKKEGSWSTGVHPRLLILAALIFLQHLLKIPVTGRTHLKNWYCLYEAIILLAGSEQLAWLRLRCRRLSDILLCTSTIVGTSTMRAGDY